MNTQAIFIVFINLVLFKQIPSKTEACLVLLSMGGIWMLIDPQIFGFQSGGIGNSTP